jgi:hypothetical protein
MFGYAATPRRNNPCLLTLSAASLLTFSAASLLSFIVLYKELSASLKQVDKLDTQTNERNGEKKRALHLQFAWRKEIAVLLLLCLQETLQRQSKCPKLTLLLRELMELIYCIRYLGF